MTQILSKSPQQREISDRVNLMLKGQLNNADTLTLTANQTTSTILNPDIHKDSKIFLTPQTANAAAENYYILSSNITGGQFIVTHANATTTDRTFQYTYLG